MDMPRGYYIDNNAFEGCTNLVSASFEAGWLVGDNAFAGCTSLTSVSVPEVRSIGYRAFAQTGTTGLSITMGEKAPPLGRNIFEGASSKSVTVHVPDAATGYDASWESAFKGLGSNGIGTVNSGISLSVTSP
ncbi:MAG: leucine-rich repeat domain-containing protein [Treponema sp.]|nr:leucine-rich repeat domain-containing protein [Treponema sp.]